MKGIVSGIKRNAVHDGDGLRTTVFFKGCPLRCIWCHNPESIGFRREIGFYADKCMSCGTCTTVCADGAVRMRDDLPVTDPTRCRACFDCTAMCPGDARIGYGEVWEAAALAEKLAQDKAFFDNSGGGVTLSGGECLAQPVFARELAERLLEKGISVNVDTCGYAAKSVFEQMLPLTDTFLYDLKAIDREVHIRCTGKENDCILENLRYLTDSGAKIEIRYPYVPGWNDGECEKIGAFLAGLSVKHRIKVLGYHGLADGKYKALGLPDTLPAIEVTADDVGKAVRILHNFGLQAVNGMKDD
ncbi:MAG: glycyl-radical enzyme activating protein [Clostridia bacterium]|nr:glycyl-radical enzyme activating protein [Clostridia bacterium]